MSGASGVGEAEAMAKTSRASRVSVWLRRKRTNGILLHALGGGAALALGVVVLLVTCWVTHAVCWITLQSFHLNSAVYVVISVVFLVLLFIGNARTDRQYLEEVSVSTGTFSDQVVTFYVPGLGMASNINPLAPDTLHTGVKLITRMLFFGPRLVTAAGRAFVKAVKLGRLDLVGCGAVLEILYQRPGRIAFEELVRAVPGLDPVKVFPQLTQVDGVLFPEQRTGRSHPGAPSCVSRLIKPDGRGQADRLVRSFALPRLRIFCTAMIPRLLTLARVEFVARYAKVQRASG